MVVPCLILDRIINSFHSVNSWIGRIQRSGPRQGLNLTSVWLHDILSVDLKMVPFLSSQLSGTDGGQQSSLTVHISFSLKTHYRVSEIRLCPLSMRDVTVSVLTAMSVLSASLSRVIHQPDCIHPRSHIWMPHVLRTWVDWSQGPKQLRGTFSARLGLLD